MALLLSLRGTPFMYYGEEIGMRDIHLRRGEILDPPGQKYWPFYKGRDGCRSPMQWDAGAQAGFSTARPWLPVHPDYLQRNVAAQQADPGSLFHFTKKLLALRKAYPALRRGDYVPLETRPRFPGLPAQHARAIRAGGDQFQKQLGPIRALRRANGKCFFPASPI